MAQSILPRHRDWYVYTATGDVQYSVLVRCDLAAIPELGWGAPDPTKPQPPKGFKCAFIYAVDGATGRVRKFPVGSMTADAYSGVDGSFIVGEIGSISGTTWQRKTAIGEKKTGPANLHP